VPVADLRASATTTLQHHERERDQQRAQVVIDEGGSVRHIRAHTKLGDFLTGAELRFPLQSFPSTGS
jgi:hypothetical protein